MPYRKSKPWGQVKPALGFGIDWGDPINAALKGRWLFNENAGKRVVNLDKPGPLGTLTNGPVWTPGNFGSAISFDGTDDYIDVDGSIIDPWLSLPADLTISFWINAATVAAGVMFVLDDNNAAGNASQWGIDINRTAGKFSYIDNNGATVALTSSTAISAGIWYFVVATVSGNTRTFYLNSVADGTATASYSRGAHSGIAFGRPGNYNGFYVNAKLNNIGMWARALSQAEIQRLYTQPFAGIVSHRRRIISQVAAAAITTRVPLRALLGVGL